MKRRFKARFCRGEHEKEGVRLFVNMPMIFFRLQLRSNDFSF
jgi:hypothetical protein